MTTEDQATIAIRERIGEIQHRIDEVATWATTVTDPVSTLDHLDRALKELQAIRG